MGQGSTSAIIWAVVAILIMAWILGWFLVPDVGSLLHILIIVAVIIIIVNVLGLLGGHSTKTTTTTRN
jgi:hypothetical protein